MTPSALLCFWNAHISLNLNARLHIYARRDDESCLPNQGATKRDLDFKSGGLPFLLKSSHSFPVLEDGSKGH